jgi:hypothetical protein
MLISRSFHNVKLATNINGWFPIVDVTFKCNYDICYLIGEYGLDITYYIRKYSTKNQNEFENLITFHLSAFDKRVGRECNLHDNVIVLNIKGHQRISSMICFLLSKQEITTPMTLYLFRGGHFYMSHEFAMLFIKHLLNTLMNANIMEASFVK